MVSKVRIFLILCCALFLITALANAGQWDKRTVVTFNRPIQLPGLVLEPGTYVFILADTPSSRHVVQVFNKDENHIYGTFLALPNSRLKPTGETVMTFGEAKRNAPEPLRAWFAPDTTWGHEFVYPKAEAREIAAATHVPVLAGEVKPTQRAEQLMETPVVAVTPEKKEVEIAQAVEPPPVQIAQAAPAPAPAPAPQAAPPAELPKTASYFPMIVLFGLAAISFALAFRFVHPRSGK